MTNMNANISEQDIREYKSMQEFDDRPIPGLNEYDYYTIEFMKSKELILDSETETKDFISMARRFDNIKKAANQLDEMLSIMEEIKRCMLKAIMDEFPILKKELDYDKQEAAIKAVVADGDDLNESYKLWRLISASTKGLA